MSKVLISDKMSPLAAEVFRARGLEVDERPGLSPEELIACIGDYDGLAIRSTTKVTDEVLAAAGNLKVIGRAGIGVDNIHVPGATQKGVVVMNAPFGNSITTAEHAIAMLLALARQIPQANQSTHDGKWEKSRFMGVEVAGKTLGLVGCGNIGSVVADRAQGLKMKVLAFDPFLSPERAEDIGVDKVELQDLFSRADFITLHTPLTDQTRNIINAEAIAAMRPGVRIINCARGGLIDEAALKAGLESGQVAGAALDVFAEEPATSNPLFGLDNVVATPHLGASTTEAQEKVAVQIAEQISDFLLEGSVTNALNMPSITAEEAPRLRPYMKLAAQVGQFAGQITETGIRSVKIEYCGHAAKLNTRALSAIVLEGLLSPLMDSANMVNAPIVAKDRGISVTESTCDDVMDYQTLVRLTIETERRERVVAGTLFSDNQPRVVQINDINVEAELGPFMIYLNNEDKPGLIGAVGKLLGDAGMNIATFHLGRSRAGGDALALIEVDETVTEDILAALSALPNIKQAKALFFDP